MPKIKFNSIAMAKSFVGRKAGRFIDSFLNGLERQKMLFLINNDKSILDLVALDIRYKYKAQAAPYKDIIQKFTIDDVYNWIPQSHRAFIEATPNGKNWALAQIKSIHEFLLSP